MKKTSWLALLSASLILAGTASLLGQNENKPFYLGKQCRPYVCTGQPITPDSNGIPCVLFTQGKTTCQDAPDQACWGVDRPPSEQFCYGWIQGTSVSCHLYVTEC